MKTVKEHIRPLIDQLPEGTEQLFVLPHMEAFPDLLYFLAQHQQTYYSPEALKALSKEAPFEFALLLNKFLDVLEIQEAWLASCEMLFSNETLGALTGTLLRQQAEKLAAAKQQLDAVRNSLPHIQQKIEQLELAAAQLGAEAPRYQALIDDKAALEEKLKGLQALETAVKEGKLEALSDRVNSLEADLQPKIQEYQRLEAAQQQLLEEQAERQQKIQLLLAETEAIALNRSFLDKLEADLLAHNQELEGQLNKQAEQVRIRLQFNRETSGGLADDTLASKFRQLQAQLEEIEKEIAVSIDAKPNTT